MPLRSVSLMKLVYGKKQNLSWEYSIQVLDYQGLLHEFCCVCLSLKRNDATKQCNNYKYDICALLGFYSVLIGCFLGMFCDNQLVPSPRVKHLTLNVGNARRTVVIVTVGDMTQVPY